MTIDNLPPSIDNSNNQKSPNPQLVALIKNALFLSKISIGLGLIAVVFFLIFGTLASMGQFAKNDWIYHNFYYLPYILVGLSMPMSVYHLFLLHRYRLLQFTILMTIIILGIGLFWLSTFMAFVAWFSIPYLAKVNLNRFYCYLTGQPVPERRKKKS